MAKNSAIEWTDDTWNPIVGCSIVSPGCTNCYAMKLAGTRLKHTAKYRGLTQPSKCGPVWTGEVRFWEPALLDPLHWRAPRRIFVNSEGDLFHEDIPDAWIDRVFAVMALAPQHVYQVLTKRAEPMRRYMSAVTPECIARAALESVGWPFMTWPLRHVWLGVSTERQQEADERIPDLLATPAETRFISAEPLIGPINLEPYLRGDSRLDWVIIAWARSIHDQCRAAGVASFMKQMTAKAPIPDDLMARQFPRERAHV